MASQLLAASEGCTAILNYDAIGLTAQSVTVDNTIGVKPVTFWINTGVVQSVTVQPGIIGQITFAVALAMILVGATGFKITGLIGYGIGVGLDTATLGV